MSGEVLVVHCVDTEGPLAGNARRLPDGSPEFFDNWDDILVSLRDLTNQEFRRGHADSFGGPYRFSWFVMDFTGFRTNPKCRIPRYHDTWDRIGSLPVVEDGLYWHYHVPPANGAGDEWSDTWLSSNECNNILARRLLERGSFPAAFRAGGTIEDEPASRWLEQTIPIDFSNRVSERSRPGADLYHFNWHGAPMIWGSYHPAVGDPMQPGRMRRFIYRSIDLRSRYNEVTEAHVERCFENAGRSAQPAVFSYFTHDTRDMRQETFDVIEMLQHATRRTGVPWRICTAVDAHQRYHGLAASPIPLSISRDDRCVHITTAAPPFQHVPFAAVETVEGSVRRVYPRPISRSEWRLDLRGAAIRRTGVAVTSNAGDTTLAFA